MDLSLFGLVPLLFGGGTADTPRTVLDAIYQPLLVGEAANLEQHYSDRLQGLVATNLALNVVDVSGRQVDPEAPGIVAFNPFLNGTDAMLQHLEIGEPVIKGETAVSLVSFERAEGPSLLSVSLVHEPDGWKVDDVASLGGQEKWLYSWLLQYDPFSQQ